MVERQLATAGHHIRRQRKIIKELGNDGHDTGLATSLLREFEKTEATYIAHRTTLREELDAQLGHVPGRDATKQLSGK
jgi:hypothetical protein